MQRSTARILFAGSCLLLVLFVSSQVFAADEEIFEPASEVAVYELAGQFVSRLDAGDYSGAWMTLDSHSRALEIPTLWQQRQSAIRAAYGPLQQRQPRPTYHRNSYAQHPDGNYIVISFASRFTSKALGVETIVIREDSGGKLSIVAYHIN